MKPALQITGAAAIAIVFGTGGYFLGKSHPSGTAPSEAGRSAASSYVPRRAPQMAAIDTANLRARLDAEKNPLTRFKLAVDQMETWVDQHPKDALAWLAGQPATERRDEILRLALEQYSETDAKNAASWALANLSGVDLNNALISIAENWAQQNGAEAVAWFSNLPVSAERNGALENILFSWATNDSAAAMDHLKTHPASADLTPTLLRAALAGWAKSDPQGAVTASLQLSRSNGNPAQFANTLANWATMDLQTSTAWLQANVQPGKDRTAAVAELGTIYAQQAPEAGIAWLKNLTAGGERNTAANTFADGWARSNPAEAAAWAASEADVSLSPEAIAAIGHSYLLKDPAGFEKWRASLPEGPLKSALPTTPPLAAE